MKLAELSDLFGKFTARDGVPPPEGCFEKDLNGSVGKISNQLPSAFCVMIENAWRAPPYGSFGSLRGWSADAASRRAAAL